MPQLSGRGRARSSRRVNDNQNNDRSSTSRTLPQAATRHVSAAGPAATVVLVEADAGAGASVALTATVAATTVKIQQKTDGMAVSCRWSMYTDAETQHKTVSYSNATSCKTTSIA